MAKSKFGLGKGLDALIPSGPVTDEEEVSVIPTTDTNDDGVSTEVLAHIAVENIEPNPYQPRSEFDEESLHELAQSIREKGLVQPVTVRRHKGGYQLISGERRVRACREAGIEFIPAYIRKVTSVQEMIELALIENLQRETLNPIEIAHSYQRLVNEFSYTQDQIATKVGKNRTTVANFIRLLKLPKEIQKSIQSDEISMGHARAIINISDPAARSRIWKKAVRSGLSVREVEKLVRALDTIGTDRKPEKKKESMSGPVEELAAKVRDMYGTKVHIRATRSGKGSINIEFYTDEDLERIVDLLLRS